MNEKIVDQTTNDSQLRRTTNKASTVPRIDAKDEAVRKASRLLVEAERPVILADSRAIWNNAYPELAQLANRLSIPVLSATRAIRPFFDESSPLNFGLYEARSAPPVLQLMEEADLLLAIDCYFDSYLSTGQLTPESPSRRRLFPDTIIQIDSDPSFIGKNYPVEVGILGDSKVILGALLAGIRSSGRRSRNKVRLDRLTTLKAKWTAFIDREYDRLSNKKSISPLVIARDLSSVLPKDAIVSVAGAFNSVVFHTLSVFTSSTPRSILGIGADGSLGTGLSKAIGAKLAAPDRCVVAFLGDGEFWYGSASELETLARTKLPVVIVISNNGCFGSDKYRQLKIFDGRFIGVDFNNPNFAELARVFGLKGERVESSNEIKRAIRRAVESNRPTIVDIVTDFSEPPPTFSGGRSPV
jgi:thiamine pyrophosphate-dependent acetolactate synthase large subunit-like protein